MYTGEWRAWMLLPVTSALTVVFLAFAVNEHVYAGAIVAGVGLLLYARTLLPGRRAAPRGDAAPPRAHDAK